MIVSPSIRAIDRPSDPRPNDIIAGRCDGRHKRISDDQPSMARSRQCKTIVRMTGIGLVREIGRGFEPSHIPHDIVRDNHIGHGFSTIVDQCPPRVGGNNNAMVQVVEQFSQ